MKAAAAFLVAFAFVLAGTVSSIAGSPIKVHRLREVKPQKPKQHQPAPKSTPAPRIVSTERGYVVILK